MQYRPMKPVLVQRQLGASLIEVLIAILLLSFGMLALGGMLAFGVQLPKLAGYRAVAVNLANAHIERVRANPTGFATDNYSVNLSYDGSTSSIALANCTYPACTETSLAAMDNAASKQAMRNELPAGGMMLTCDTTPCTGTSFGNLWIVWQEPTTYAALNPAVSDNCPVAVTGTYTDPRPRCLYVRFKL